MYNPPPLLGWVVSPPCVGWWSPSLLMVGEGVSSHPSPSWLGSLFSSFLVGTSPFFLFVGKKRKRKEKRKKEKGKRKEEKYQKKKKRRTNREKKKKTWKTKEKRKKRGKNPKGPWHGEGKSRGARDDVAVEPPEDI